MKIRPVVAYSVWTNGQTDTTKLMVLFSVLRVRVI